LIIVLFKTTVIPTSNPSPYRNYVYYNEPDRSACQICVDIAGKGVYTKTVLGRM
jgi:hypothetical protein